MYVTLSNLSSSAGSRIWTESPRKYEPVIAKMCALEFDMMLRKALPNTELSSRLTWWNSSIAKSVLSNSESSNSSKANRNVACVAIRILSLGSVEFMNLTKCWTFDFSPPPIVKLLLGFTSQSQWKPNFDNSVSLNDLPIERSGTAMITFLIPWLWSLSNPTNINARDLPDAGGDFTSKYCDARFS